MPQQEWTKQPPTEEGWYWACPNEEDYYPGMSSAQIVRVKHYKKGDFVGIGNSHYPIREDYTGAEGIRWDHPISVNKLNFYWLKIEDEPLPQTIQEKIASQIVSMTPEEAIMHFGKLNPTYPQEIGLKESRFTQEATLVLKAHGYHQVANCIFKWGGVKPAHPA